MKRKFILFGNGLGRALDNDFCCIERGLQEAWDSDVLSEPQKALVHSCLREQVIESELSAPTSEEELGDLQRVLNSCDTILEFENRVQDDGWLTESGIEFPKAIFIGQPATSTIQTSAFQKISKIVYAGS